MRGRGLISAVAGIALCVHAQTSIDLQVMMDDTYRTGGVSALRPDGGVVWRGELKRGQATTHLRGSIAGARFLRVEWQRADGRRGRRQQSVTLDEHVLAVEGTASFKSADEEPFLDGALMVSWPATLKVIFTKRDDATGMATVEIVNEGSEFFDAPEVRVDRQIDGGWIPAARVQCEEGEEAFVFPKRTARVSVASMNCVPSPLAPGPYRRVVRLQRSAGLRRGLEETVQLEELFAAAPARAPVVVLPHTHFWSVRLAGPQLRGDEELLFCACEGLTFGQERYVFGRGACAVPPDGGECEPLLLQGKAIGDFPPY